MSRMFYALGIVAVLALLVVFFPRGEKEGEQPPPGEAVRKRTPSARSTSGDTGSRAGGAPTRQRQPLAEHQPEDLARFILPLVEGRDVNLKTAVGILTASYRDACHRTRTQPLKLEIDLPAEAATRFSFSLERATFDGALAYLAALAGHTVRADGLQVYFEPGPDGTKTDARQFRGRPAYQTVLAAQLQRLGFTHDGSLAGMAAALGITAPGREFTMAPGVTIFNGTGAELLRMETWLACMPPIYPLKTTAILIQTGKPLDPDPGESTPDGIREWLATIGSQPGVTMTTAPATTVRDAQPGKIEIIQGPPDNWTGKRITIEAERAGLAILVKDTTEYRPDNRSTPVIRDTRQGVFHSGEPQVSLVSNRDGDCLYRVLTLELITPPSNPAGVAPGNVTAIPVPGRPGYVTSPHSGKIVDVRDIPPGTLVADPDFPAGEGRHFRVP
jgi:hypothetical protein